MPAVTAGEPRFLTSKFGSKIMAPQISSQSVHFTMLKCGTVYFNLDCSTDEMYAKIYIILDPNFDVKNAGSPAVTKCSKF